MRTDPADLVVRLVAMEPVTERGLVGYELLAETQRDLAPEEPAERLREMVDAVRR